MFIKLGFGLLVLVLGGGLGTAMVLMTESTTGIVTNCLIVFLLMAGLNAVLEYRAGATNRALLKLDVDAKAIQIEGLKVDVQRKIVTNSLVLADSNGLYPLTVSALDDRMIQIANLQIAHRFQESKDNVISSFSYTNKVSNTGVAGEPVALLGNGAAPDFWSLVESGKLPVDKMLLGFDKENNQVCGTWGEIRSTLVGGKSGFGKSTMLRSMLAQAALQGSNFVVIDPHYNSGDESLGHSLQPLKSLLLTDVAHDDATMSQALSYVQDVGLARLSGKDMNRTPIVLVVDEVTALLSRSNVTDQLNKTLQFIATETRKVNVFCFAAGQNFNASIMPSETRNNFVSMFGFQMRKDTARAMSGNNEFAQQVESLAIGQMVWFAPSGDCIPVAVPNVTEDTLKRVAERRFGNPDNIGVEVDFQGTSKALPEPWKVIKNDDLEVSGSDAGSGLEVSNSAENVRILQLFLAGNSITSIVKTVYGIDGGRNFPIKSDYVQSVIRNKIR